MKISLIPIGIHEFGKISAVTEFPKFWIIFRRITTCPIATIAQFVHKKYRQ